MCLRIRKKNAEHTGHRGKKSVFQRGEAIHVILSARVIRMHREPENTGEPLVNFERGHSRRHRGLGAGFYGITVTTSNGNSGKEKVRQ